MLFHDIFSQFLAIFCENGTSASSGKLGIMLRFDFCFYWITVLKGTYCVCIIHHHPDILIGLHMGKKRSVTRPL